VEKNHGTGSWLGKILRREVESEKGEREDGEEEQERADE